MENASDDWLFDTLIQFLRSPLWICPIQNFIDENCAIFTDDGEESTLQQGETHIKFRKLMESLLDKYFLDLGITAEDFYKICLKESNQDLKNLILETILSIDDYQIFKQMMYRRHLQLEYDVLKNVKNDEDENPESEEDAELRKAIAASLQEQELFLKQQELEDAALKQALQMSLALEEEFKTMRTDIEQAILEAQQEIDTMNKELDSEELNIKKQLQELQEASAMVKDVIQQTTELCKESSQLQITEKPVAKTAIKLKPLSNAPIIESKESHEPIIAKELANDSSQNKPSHEEVEKRIQFLKQQKEKLVKQRQTERENEAKSTNVVLPVEAVPKSLPPSTDSETSSDDKLKLRLMLAQQLKEGIKK